MNGVHWPIPYNIIRLSEYVTDTLPVQSSFYGTVTQYNQNTTIRQGTANQSNLAMAAMGLPWSSTTACGPAFRNF